VKFLAVLSTTRFPEAVEITLLAAERSLFSHCKTSPNFSPNCAPYTLRWLQFLLCTPLKTCVLRALQFGFFFFFFFFFF
jgi:hypothetical protein